MKLSIEMLPQIKYQPTQASLAYTRQPWTAGACMRSAGFWGWTPAVGSLVCSIPLWLCWENSPDLLSALWRLWVKAAGCYWCLFLRLSPKPSHFFSTSFYFPLASYRAPEDFPLGVRFIASEKVQAKGRKEAGAVGVRGDAAVGAGRRGWELEPAACRALPGGGVPPGTALGCSGSCHQLGPLLWWGGDLLATRK